MLTLGECRAGVGHAVRAARSGCQIVISRGMRAVARKPATSAASISREAITPFDERASYTGSSELASLVYELLDAHFDTTRLACTLTCDEQWAAHLDYLQALQRSGREALARAPTDVSA